MPISIEQINHTGAAYEACASQLEQRLLRSLHDELQQSENKAFVLVAKTAKDELVAGLAASTSYDWLLIKILWVAETNREEGLGKQLLIRAEQHGIDCGCHSAWLDTSNPIAEQFYRNNGYEEFGRLENGPTHTPSAHKRWFLKKVL